ncbi:MAG: VCBS repeat-containing protein [Planctomycetota bacterium]
MNAYLPRACGRLAAALATVLGSLSSVAIADEALKLSFLPQTGVVALAFADRDGDAIALAGRDDDGLPRLAFLVADDTGYRIIERALPEDAVAIDAGPAGAGDALFVLCASSVERLSSIDGDFEPLASVESLYRGRSFAPLTASLNLADDIDGDGDSELLVQGFDTLAVIDGAGYDRLHTLELPSIRRSFERAQNYRPVRTAHALIDETPTVIAVRGDDLLRYRLDSLTDTVAGDTEALGLGLSSEREIERFYNGDPELDQRDVTLHEPELLTDLNGDDLPDLVTLETISTGVFDKQTTYRVHLANADAGFNTTSDTVISSKGYQFYIRTVQLEEDRIAIVSPGVRIGVRTIIGALFSRSVTLDIAVHTSDDSGVIAEAPSAEIRAKVRFDFGSGQAEFPTVEFGDLDGDGRQDLILKRGRDKLGWRRNLGDGMFDRRGTEIDLVAPKNGSNVFTADLDGDGTDEVIARYDMQDGEALRRTLQVATP